MPRRNFGAGQEIVIEDFNKLSSAILRELYDRVIYEVVQRSENSFFGDGFLVSYASANSVIIKKGVGFQSDVSQVSPEPNKRLLYRSADITQNISAPDSSNDRIDIVCVRAAIVDELFALRNVKDEISDDVTEENLVVQKDWQAEILVVDGTPAISPSIPATPSGYIKIAELYVNTASGLSGAGDVDDKRTKMPVGGDTVLNTVGYDRVTAGASTPLSTIIADIDALLKNGYFEHFDIDVLTVEPDAPDAGKIRIFFKDGVLYYKDENDVNTPVGSGGGGGGGGANWQPVSGLSPSEAFEYDEKVWNFEQSQNQALTLWVRVPASYISGRQIGMKAAFYSPSSSNNFAFQAVATLIRKNNDAIDSAANNNTDGSGDVVNTVSKQLREVSFDLSSITGTINGVSVNAGDLIKVKLSRIAPGGTEDSEDIRFIPSSTEISFS